MPAPDIPGVNFRDFVDPAAAPLRWNESVLNIYYPRPDIPLGSGVYDYSTGRLSVSVLSTVAQQTADREKRTISVQNLGTFIPSDQKELLEAQRIYDAAQASERRSPVLCR